MLLPDLPTELVRKIFAYNIPRCIDKHDPDIARMYNIRPDIRGTFMFLSALNATTSPYDFI